MTNEDYQLEEFENAAVNKSNNAKRIAAAAGLLVGGGVAGGAASYAATKIPFGSTEEPIETLTEEDIDSVADTGASQVQEPEMKPQPVQPQPSTPVQPTEPVEVEDEMEVTFDKTTHYYDEENNLLITEEEGTIDGRQFKLLDVDGDMRADYFAYDADGNGVINEDEIVELSGKDQIAMGNATSQHEDIFLTMKETDPEPEIYDPYDPDAEKDYTDNTIHNDFEDEKTGETYSHDYAENNEDYNNNGDIDHYSASSSDSDYAYADIKDDDDYNEYAENNTTDDMFDDLGSDSLDIV